MDVDNKLNNYLRIAGVISNVLRPKKIIKNRKKLYSTLTLPTLLSGSENWAIKSRDANRITAAKRKYMIRTSRYT
jgi:hypothetical protein